MHIFHHGPAPAQLPYGTYAEQLHWSALRPDTPPFLVDALVVHPTLAEDAQVALLASYGRPVQVVADPGSVEELAALASPGKRTNYRPIDCNFYDIFEIAIMRGTQVQLVVRGATGEETERTTRLRDTRTDRTEEFVQLEDGSWLRLDRVISVDGVRAGDRCGI